VTASEYLQLKAFARIDGVWVALWLVASFACYVAGLSLPGFGLAALVLAVGMPFFAGYRLRKFRDDNLDGEISFARGWGYVTFVFFYAALLFALVQYAYFAYLDRGYMVDSLSRMMTEGANAEMLRQMGMTQQMSESLDLLRSLRPIDMAISMLELLFLSGLVLGIPIAAVLQKKKTIT